MNAQRSFRSTASPDLLGQPVSGRLEVNVIFTDVPGTLIALRQAACLARDLGGTLRVIVPQIVPYPLPLETPPVSAAFSERRFRTLTEDQAIETHIQLCLCRDRDRLLEELLPSRSLVVIGARRRWWPAEVFLACRLRRRSHEVIVVRMEEKRVGSVIRSNRRGLLRRCLDLH